MYIYIYIYIYTYKLFIHHELLTNTGPTLRDAGLSARTSGAAWATRQSAVVCRRRESVSFIISYVYTFNYIHIYIYIYIYSAGEERERERVAGPQRGNTNKGK